MNGAFTTKLIQAFLNGGIASPLIAGTMNQFSTVNDGETITKKISEIIKVESNRYLMLFVYVSFGTLNNPVNHLPIAVNGMKLEMQSDNTKATPKLSNMLSQFKAVKVIVKTPESKSVAFTKADVKHKQKQTGISQIKL